jgi:hypothetical protein
MGSRCLSVLVPPLPPTHPHLHASLSPLSTSTVLCTHMGTMLAHRQCSSQPATARLALDCKRALPSQNILTTSKCSTVVTVQLDTFTWWPAHASPLVTCGRQQSRARDLRKKLTWQSLQTVARDLTHTHTRALPFAYIHACMHMCIIKCCPQVS